MSDLVRSTSSGGDGGAGQRTRIFLVRQPVKSVRHSDLPNPLPIRLAIGVIVALGALAACWLIGFLGSVLSLASLMHMPALHVSVADGFLSSTMIAMTIPGTIIRTGIEHPLLLMLAYGLIALPAGCLAGVRTATPGGPRPHVLSVVFSYTVAILCALQSCALIYWVISPFRAALIAPLPLKLASISAWQSSMQSAAGLDLLAFIVAALWVVLIMRVAIPVWLRSLCAPAAIIALVIVTMGMATTNATIANVHSPRTVIAPTDDATPTRLIVGRAAEQTALLSVTGNNVTIELARPDGTIRIAEQQSIIEFLRAAAD